MRVAASSRGVPAGEVWNSAAPGSDSGGVTSRWIKVLVAGWLTAAVTVAAACGSGPAELSGYTLDPPPVVGDLALPDTAVGEEMALRAEEGGLLLLFFGYTSCPDVCPLTMANIRQALRDLGDRADRVQVAMVTVDPDRDTPEVLTEYVHTFVPDGHALRADDDAALRLAADRFGVSYSVTTTDDGSVEVAHTGTVFVIDEHGEVVLGWSFGTTAAEMTGDLAALLS